MKRRRGRPTGRGAQTRAHLYTTAIELFEEHGYPATTLRGIADKAGVSPGLLYRYFPSKSAVVLALYDNLSTQFQEHVQTTLEPGTWYRRCRDTMRLSLRTLKPHRSAMQGVLPAMLTDTEVGLFSLSGREGRLRVQGCFITAVQRADNAPKPAVAEALGRLMDLAHLGVIMWWLLDRSPNQRATDLLLDWMAGLETSVSAVLWIPGTSTALQQLDSLVLAALYELEQWPSSETPT